MRVIAGRAKGIELRQVPTGVARASLGRVRESLFGWLGERARDADVLDLFAGSGSLGIEALSRGARTGLFVDNSRSSIDVLRANLERTGLAKSARIVRHNALTLFRLGALAGSDFDLVFIDPPYAMLRDAKLFAKFLRMLEELAAGEFLAPDARVVCKHERGLLGDASGGLQLEDRRRYRHAEVSVFLSGGASSDFP